MELPLVVNVSLTIRSYTLEVNVTLVSKRTAMGINGGGLTY